MWVLQYREALSLLRDMSFTAYWRSATKINPKLRNKCFCHIRQRWLYRSWFSGIHTWKNSFHNHCERGIRRQSSGIGDEWNLAGMRVCRLMYPKISEHMRHVAENDLRSCFGLHRFISVEWIIYSSTSVSFNIGAPKNLGSSNRAICHMACECSGLYSAASATLNKKLIELFATRFAKLVWKQLVLVILGRGDVRPLGETSLLGHAKSRSSYSYLKAYSRAHQMMSVFLSSCCVP